MLKIKWWYWISGFIHIQGESLHTITYFNYKSDNEEPYVILNFTKKAFFTLKYDVAAKSLQSCPTLCDPIDGSLPGSPIPGILQARTLERAAISFSNV